MNQLEVQRRNIIFFSANALKIQKVFRGFLVRKKHNFYKRKRQLQQLYKLNQDFKVKMDLQSKIELQEEIKRKEELAKAQFSQLAKNLHHLTSTNAIPGVYNSPFFDMKPTAFNEPVQNHLKKVFRQNYKWKAPDLKQITKYGVVRRNSRTAKS